MIVRFCLAAAAVAFGLADVAAAQTLPEGTYGLQLENDVGVSDRHYTHGTRLYWTSRRAAQGPGFVRKPLEFLWLPGDFQTARVSLIGGQNIFTPEDKEATEVVPDDRPYAGWLYVGGAVHQESLRGDSGGHFDELTTLELDVGVVGPWALGEETQRSIHDFGPTKDPAGWANQLDNEPAVVLWAERKWRSPVQRLGALELDVVPRLTGALGNVYTLAGLSTTLRLGQNLDIDYGAPLIRPGPTGSEAVARDQEIAWYLYGAIEGRAIARNIFLDGNTFSSSHSVDKKPFVADLAGGATFVWRGIRLTASAIWRTKEFNTQKQTNVFGAVTLAVGL